MVKQQYSVAYVSFVISRLRAITKMMKGIKIVF